MNSLDSEGQGADKIFIDGIPNDLPEAEDAIVRSRLIRDASPVMQEHNIRKIEIIRGDSISAESTRTSPSKNGTYPRGANDELSVDKRAEKYQPVSPYLNSELLYLPDDIKNQLEVAIRVIELRPKVFDEWGLSRIEPNPKTVLNCHGPSGTGKTLAAHFLAHKLRKKIIIASYADIESKYHGDGPKNVEAIFYAAKYHDAILFIDEADSLLSKRLTNVTQGSEQAINSMRSQLLICLETIQGIVIFATNLAENYDKAFETRMRNIYFSMPDESARYEIWKRHLGDGLHPPLASDLSAAKLAKVEDICGRDIKNAVVNAALSAASEREYIAQADFESAIEQIKASQIKRPESSKLVPTEVDKATSKKIRDQVDDILGE